jgi:hypothetical protein
MVSPVVTPSDGQALSVTISPLSLQLNRGASSKFSAAVANANDTSVTWSIQEGPTGGAITDVGVYTAPSADGVYHVLATSKTDPKKSATAIVSVGASAFTLTGNLAAGRFGHTATLLPSGQVVVVGGLSASGSGPAAFVSPIEQFDPAKGTFQSIGNLARASHSATLLANGDVLIAGGSIDLSSQGQVPTDSAELLTAGTGAVQPTGKMGAPRTLHTATLLQDGRVLITGGEVLSETKIVVTATAELYDPVSGMFTPAGSMSVPRIFHSATLLPNGKVLVTGWWASAELYDPATNSFTATGSMAGDRFAYTATLLSNGKVLIAGGETYYDVPYEGAAEIYDPGTGQFTRAGQMLALLWGQTATLLPDGTVLLAGGEIAPTDTSTPQTEIFHPDTSSFTPGPTMSHGRVSHTATLLPDGSVLVVGGGGIPWLSGDNSAEIYP